VHAAKGSIINKIRKNIGMNSINHVAINERNYMLLAFSKNPQILFPKIV